MCRNKPSGGSERQGSEERDLSAPQVPSTHSKLGDTQPYRPPTTYRPLTSEPPIEEEENVQKTAPYRAIRPARTTPTRKGVSLSMVLAIVALLLVLAAIVAYFVIIKGANGASGGTLPVESILPAGYSILLLHQSPACGEPATSL